MLPSPDRRLGIAALESQPTLAALTADPAASPGQPGQALHLDCRALPHQYTLGVCHQVSQLLLLRQAGVTVWLYQVNPVLHRCLQLLRITHLFSWAA